MRCWLPAFALLLGLFSSLVLADDPPHESWTFSLNWENDLFAKTDRFYTNGVQLNWISPELKYFEDLAWIKNREVFSRQLKQIISLLPYSDDPTRQRHFSFSLGQKIYTPENIEASALQEDDRPYGGWLYGDIAFHSKNKRRLDTFEIQLGMIGPVSLAEEAQNFVHSIRGIQQANGWGNQLDNELGIVLVYDRKQRLFRRTDFYDKLGFDSILHAGGAAGNVFTHLSSGAEFRLGWNLPTDFGSALIRPAGNTNAPTDAGDPRYEKGKQSLSFYLFTAVNGRLVLRDIFLDGNTFSDSHSIDKKNIVGEFIVGSAISYRSFKLSYAQVFLTREFETQSEGSSFGSLSISYTY